MQLEECINFKLTHVQNTVFNYFKAKLAPFDVTPIQYAILKCLWVGGSQSPGQLAQAVHLDSSTITGILGRMEKKGLLERQHSSTDRRAVSIQLKPPGAALRPGIEKAIEEANQEVLRGFGAEDYAAFSDALARIVNEVEQLERTRTA